MKILIRIVQTVLGFKWTRKQLKRYLSLLLFLLLPVGGLLLVHAGLIHQKIFAIFIAFVGLVLCPITIYESSKNSSALNEFAEKKHISSFGFKVESANVKNVFNELKDDDLFFEGSMNCFLLHKYRRLSVDECEQMLQICRKLYEEFINNLKLY